MHLKKNICESLVGTIMNTKGKGKDHENARADLEEMGIRPELYVEEQKMEKTLLQPPPQCLEKRRKNYANSCIV